MKPVEYQSAKEQQARAMIASRKTEQLVLDYEITNALTMSTEVIIVRGWIADELEARFPEKMWDFYESDDESPRAYVIA